MPGPVISQHVCAPDAEPHLQVIGELPLQVGLVLLELEDIPLQLSVVLLQGLELV